MEADFVAQHPDAIITSIPEKAYHDPEAAKQLQYDMAEIVATMSPVYKHGKKFKENSGRKPDSFTKLLESIFTDYHNQNGCFPNYRKVLKTLKQQMGDGFIHTVEDDGTIEWGEKGNTSLATLKNKLSNIRKKIKSR